MGNRRQIVVGMASAGVLIGGRGAFGHGMVQLVYPVPQPLPIAIPDFVAAVPADGEVGGRIAGAITEVLKQSRLFVPIDPAAFAGKADTFDAPPPVAEWQAVGAWVLLAGRVSRIDDGRLKVQFRLWDVANGQQLAGEQYAAAADNWRRVADTITDTIWERVSGTNGPFGTSR